MEARTPADSKVTLAQGMLPGDANQFGYVHGGTIMKLVDMAAGVVAIRHARARVATAGIDRMSFLAPARVGDVIHVKASLNYVGRSSMEVGARVDVEDPLTGRMSHMSSAYLTMVALDDKGAPLEVPSLTPETVEDKRRMSEGKIRRIRREWSRKPAGPSQSVDAPSPTPGQARPDHPRPYGTALPGGMRPLVVGHRGAAGHAPENTLAAYEKGIELGADVIECDVQLTSDGRLAVIHDHLIDRTTNGTGPVGAYTMEELKRFSAGVEFDPKYESERIPELWELIELARNRVHVSIEIKQGPVFHPKLVETLVREINRLDAVEDVLVISFDHKALKEARTLDPRLATGVLYAARPVDGPALARAADAQALLPNWSMITKEDVDEAHAAGLLLLPWTANDPQAIEALLAIGVDGLASDYPDRVRQAVDALSG